MYSCRCPLLLLLLLVVVVVVVVRFRVILIQLYRALYKMLYYYSSSSICLEHLYKYSVVGSRYATILPEFLDSSLSPEIQ